MENQINLKLNLETAKNNPIGFTQWLARELLKRAYVSREEWKASIKAIQYLNRFRTMVEEAKQDELMEANNLAFKDYLQEKANGEMKVEEIVVETGGA